MDNLSISLKEYMEKIEGKLDGFIIEMRKSMGDLQNHIDESYVRKSDFRLVQGLLFLFLAVGTFVISYLGYIKH